MGRLLVEIIVGQTYHYTGSDKSFGRAVGSGSLRTMHNRKLKVIRLYQHPDTFESLCECELISGNPADIGLIIPDVKCSLLGNETTFSMGQKLRVYSPELSTVLVGPVLTGGKESLEANSAEIMQITELLISQGHNVYAPALTQFLLLQCSAPLADWITPFHWKSYYITLLRRCEQVLYYLPDNWRDSIELKYTMDSHEQLHRSGCSYKVDLAGNISRFPGE